MRSVLGALVLACSLAAGYGQEAAPVNLHAANAAEAADVAQQAAKVAKRVAAHTEEVAHDTAAALRYTRDALKRAGANDEDIAEVGKQADKLEEEAGITSGDASRESSSRSGQGEDSEHVSSELRDGDGSGRSGRGGAGGSSGSGVSRSSSGSEGSNGSGGKGGRGGSGAGPEGEGGEAGEGGASGEGVRGLDVNSEIVPYPNGVEPFGQEEPAKKLTKEAVKQGDGMIDQIENAQGVEAKRSVYRALTKLRGATIASYDGMAKGHLKNVDNYNKKHKWREDHPMKHLAEEEADTHVWAFPKRGSKKSKVAKKEEKKEKDIPPPAGVASPAPAEAA